MKKDKIAVVKFEMARLSAAIRRLEDATLDDLSSSIMWSPKHTGTVRRASMDLTRALAELRRY